MAAPPTCPPSRRDIEEAAHTTYGSTKLQTSVTRPGWHRPHERRHPVKNLREKMTRLPRQADEKQAMALTRQYDLP